MSKVENISQVVNKKLLPPLITGLIRHQHKFNYSGVARVL